ncbi:MAG: SPFH/Band 7/PHB domain protein [Silvanigrellales bacterium]|jgi:regulator of protease activity HflC (stomatin/prohibitin superfamily)|nr:SPFH/Band 7/PHB domain protein [Silvanigrellales bacterium]
MEFITILFAVIVAVAVLTVVKGIYVVRQQETVVVERLGRFHRLFESGLNILIPFLDQPRHIQWVRNGIVMFTDRIDMREVVLDIAEQRVITNDNVGITVDAIIYMQLLDPKRAAYEIQSLPLAVSQLTQTTLRNLIGEMELDATLSSRDAINTRLKTVLDEATDKWGIKVTRVELKNINPPADVQQAMEKQMQAERERRAHVLEAEGLKQSRVLEAEGDKRARIERSEGEKQEKINQALGDREALIARAEGQAQGIEAVADAQAKAIAVVRSAFGSPEVAANYLVAMEYLKRFGEFNTKPTDKVFIPYEATAGLGSLGGIRELFDKGTPGRN